MLKLEQAQQSWTFEGVDAAPVPSVLRNFSAPVKLEVEGQSEADLVRVVRWVGGCWVPIPSFGSGWVD